MSYAIYKTIKQNSDNTFDVVCADSNVFNHNNGRDFNPYHMTWFRDTYPNATNKEVRAIWYIYSLWSGDKFYPANWKEGKRMASRFLKAKGYDIHDAVKDEFTMLMYARELLTWMNENKEFKKKYVVKINHNGEYISEKRRNQIYTTPNKDYAKVFTDKLSELQRKLDGYAKYGLVFEEV